MSETAKCPKCKGSGEVWVGNDFMDGDLYGSCNDCVGTGRAPSAPPSTPAAPPAQRTVDVYGDHYAEAWPAAVPQGEPPADELSPTLDVDSDLVRPLRTVKIMPQKMWQCVAQPECLHDEAQWKACLSCNPKPKVEGEPSAREWPTTAEGWADMYLEARNDNELEQLHIRFGNKIGQGALAECFRRYAQQLLSQQAGRVEKSNELIRQVNTEAALAAERQLREQAVELEAARGERDYYANLHRQVAGRLRQMEVEHMRGAESALPPEEAK